MASVVFYFQVHQPFRLRRYSIFDSDANYFDNWRNETVCRKVAGKCYLPANQTILDLIRRHEGRFRVSYSLTGTIIEQFQQWAPEVLESFHDLAETGCVEFIAETYYHCLAFLYNRDEFVAQTHMHRRLMRDLFGQEPRIFRNTELIYNNDVAKVVEDMGFDAILTEGADHILGYRSPNFIYNPPNCGHLRMLLKNYRLSDDIAFRFSNRGWTEWPLTAEKFARWVDQINGNGYVCNLFMDYETFGEHQWADTGIFEFLRVLPEKILAGRQERLPDRLPGHRPLPLGRRGGRAAHDLLGRHRAGHLRLAGQQHAGQRPARGVRPGRPRAGHRGRGLDRTTGASSRPPTTSTTCAPSGSPTATCTSTSIPTSRPTTPTSTS